MTKYNAFSQELICSGQLHPLLLYTNFMDDRNFKLAEDLVNPAYIRLAQNSLNKRDKIVKQLLSQRQLPQEPIDEPTINYLLDTFSLMDSNNFNGKVGVGERQSRIFSRLVAERHFFMGHGIGRSGDIMANQPKAAGSSLILQLTRYLTVSALHQLNYQFVKDILPLPLATGMSLTLALLTLHELRPQRKYVIWSRIDQKTCLKSIISANLKPVVVNLKLEGDCLCTDLEAIQAKIKEIGPENILAIMSTTSCFAPRVPDRVDHLGLLAKQYGLYNVVNNAYGVWCSKIAHMIKEAFKAECTVVVQSTDKNFMVPVGGSFVFCKDPALLEKISAKYPGRASGSPILDLFITLLSMGKRTIQQLKASRKNNFTELLHAGKTFAEKHGCRLLNTPTNSISIAMHFMERPQEASITELGSILYSKRVMGHRIVVSSANDTMIGENTFKNYGSHSQHYAFLPYMTFACAVGTEKTEITLFFQRLEQSWKELKRKAWKKEKNFGSTKDIQTLQVSLVETKEQHRQQVEEKENGCRKSEEKCQLPEEVSKSGTTKTQESQQAIVLKDSEPAEPDCGQL